MPKNLLIIKTRKIPLRQKTNQGGHGPAPRQKTNLPIPIHQTHDHQLLTTEVVHVLRRLTIKTVKETETTVLQKAAKTKQTNPTEATP